MKAKWCWVATETRKGWRLKLSIGPRDYPVRGVLFESGEDVSRVTGKRAVVYVHLKER
jgi:hypothetical protein